MNIYLITVDTDFCGEYEHYIAFAESESDFDEYVELLAYENWCECGHDWYDYDQYEDEDDYQSGLDNGDILWYSEVQEIDEETFIDDYYYEKEIIYDGRNISDIEHTEWLSRLKKKYSGNKCEHCGTRGQSVHYTENPYLKDIGGVRHYEYICDNCYESLCGDI